MRLYWQLIDSPAWRALSHADIRVYIAMRRRLGATNNGDINATLAELKHDSIKSSSTLAKSLRALEVLGFIDKTRQGGIANGGKMCSLFRFTDEGTYDIGKAGVKAGPPTNEWQKFRSIAHAKAVLKEAHKAARRPNQRNPKPRNSSRNVSKFESEKQFSDSEIEHNEKTPLRNSRWRKDDEIARKPA